ncbi:MAG: glycosyltransferase family 39 protein [Chloroflexi bacterium]|nr:glycosyltransferase family 39 protein [Chloroflexota bacterium]
MAHPRDPHPAPNARRPTVWTEPAPALPAEWAERALLFCILMVAGVLRAWDLRQGLPFILHPDEGSYLLIVQGMLKTGDPNPHFLTYPSFFFYANAALSLAHYGVGRLMGLWTSVQELPAPTLIAMGVGHTSMPSTILLGRWLSVAAGLGLVAIAYAIGRRASGRGAVGLIAAALLALSPSAIQNCRSMTADPLGILWMAVTVWAALGILQRGGWRDYVVAALAAGLAASSKYNLALSAVAILIAHLLRWGPRALLRVELYGAAAVTALAFFAATPYALIEWPTFVAGLRYQANHYSTGHSGLEGEAARWYLAYLWQSEGPAMVSALAETLRAAVRRDRSLLLIGGFALFYLVFVSLFTVRNPWTIMPMIPYACVLAASGGDALCRLLTGRPRAVRNALAVALVLALLAVPGVQSLQRIADAPSIDSRVAAAQWLATALPAGARVAVESYSAYLDPARYDVQGLVQFNLHPPEWYVEQGYEYLVCGRGMYGRYYADPARYPNEVAAYDRLFGAFALLRAFPDPTYEVRVYAVR